MFTVFLSHNEICSRHHFSQVTLKVWQNFHTEVSAALQTPSVSKTALAPLSFSISADSCLSLLLKDSNLDSITFLQPFDQNNRQTPGGSGVRHKSIGNERGLEGGGRELSKRHDERFVILIGRSPRETFWSQRQSLRLPLTTSPPPPPQCTIQRSSTDESFTQVAGDLGCAD